MWTYIGGRHGEKRREAWIWTAVSLDPGGRRRLDFEIGDRSEAPFLRLYGRLPEAGAYYSDSYGVYEAWLPPAQHKRGKGGAANWNEGEHSRLRGKLNRLMRQTKGYSKDGTMLAGSVALVCLRLGLMQ
jgi:IS1 family transposase